jgi:hypothetical protein
MQSLLIIMLFYPNLYLNKFPKKQASLDFLVISRINVMSGWIWGRRMLTYLELFDVSKDMISIEIFHKVERCGDSNLKKNFKKRKDIVQGIGRSRPRCNVKNTLLYFSLEIWNIFPIGLENMILEPIA